MSLAVHTIIWVCHQPPYPSRLLLFALLRCFLKSIHYRYLCFKKIPLLMVHVAL